MKPQKGRCLIQCKQLPKQILTMCQSEMVATCEPLCKAGESVTRLWTYHHLVHTYKIGYKRFRVFFFFFSQNCLGAGEGFVTGTLWIRGPVPRPIGSGVGSQNLEGTGYETFSLSYVKSSSNFLSISFWLFPSSFSTLFSFTFLS